VLKSVKTAAARVGGAQRTLGSLLKTTSDSTHGVMAGATIGRGIAQRQAQGWPPGRAGRRKSHAWDEVGGITTMSYQSDAGTSYTCNQPRHRTAVKIPHSASAQDATTKSACSSGGDRCTLEHLIKRRTDGLLSHPCGVICSTNGHFLSTASCQIVSAQTVDRYGLEPNYSTTVPL